jgi:hypothetical protein
MFVEGEAMIEVRGVTQHYGIRPVLRAIELPCRITPVGLGMSPHFEKL